MSLNTDEVYESSDSEDDEFVPQESDSGDEAASSVDEEQNSKEDSEEKEKNSGVKRKQEEVDDSNSDKRARADVLNGTSKKSTTPPPTQESTPEQKSRIDALWADFATPTISKKENTNVPKTKTITEQYVFAGETINMTRKVNTTSTSNSPISLFPSSTIANPKSVSASPVSLSSEFTPAKIAKSLPTSIGKSLPKSSTTSSTGKHSTLASLTSSKSTSAVRKPSALTTLAASLEQPKKLNTLEKSKMDWQGFVEKEGIEDELRYANKDGYLERMDFLGRVDARGEATMKEMRKKK